MTRLFSSPVLYPAVLLLFSTLGCSQASSSDETLPSGETAAKLQPPDKMPVAVAKTHVQRTPTSHAQLTAEGQLGPGRGTILIDLKPAKGTKLTADAPVRISAHGNDLAFPESIKTNLDISQLPLRLPVDVADGAIGPAMIDLSYYYCMDGDAGSCRPERAQIELNLDLSGDAAGGEAHVVHSPAF